MKSFQPFVTIGRHHVARGYVLIPVVMLATLLLGVEVAQTQPSWDQTLPAKERFVLVMGGAAVLDKNTGLVWEQSPGETDGVPGITDKDMVTWSFARLQCIRRGVGGQMGWRLPSVPELTSLLVPGDPAGSPDLPAGHPFSNVQSAVYWSATTNADFPTNAWLVLFGVGVVNDFKKTGAFFVWCVRGGMNADLY